VRAGSTPKTIGPPQIPPFDRCSPFREKRVFFRSRGAEGNSLGAVGAVPPRVARQMEWHGAVRTPVKDRQSRALTSVFQVPPSSSTGRLSPRHIYHSHARLTHPPPPLQPRRHPALEPGQGPRRLHVPARPVGRVVTPGCQIGHMRHTGCHQAVFSLPQNKCEKCQPYRWDFADENDDRPPALNLERGRGGSVGRILAALSPNSRNLAAAGGVGTHSRGVSGWLHGACRLSSTEPCFDAPQ
jgi:hypothetical protein